VAFVHNFNVIEVKIRVTAEIFFDDAFRVFFVDFNLAFYEALVLSKCLIRIISMSTFLFLVFISSIL
jgi:hypothetical protein